jgi:AGCS family alanine or glycine:cation symporter
VGAVAKLDFVWSLSDTFNGLMAIPNLIGLLALSPVIVRETRDFFNKGREVKVPGTDQE